MIYLYELDRTKLYPPVNAPRQPTDAERAALAAQHARAVSALKAMGVSHE